MVKVDVSSDSYEALIAEAGKLLREGGLVVFPTETVYGIGANADLPEAVQRLRRVKGRSPTKPFASLVCGVSDVRRFVGKISPLALVLMDEFWPGPVTVVLEDAQGETRGFRCPAHKVALDLVRAAGVRIFAPSANPSGTSEPRSAAEVERSLGDKVDMILDAGPCKYGRPSTVVKVASDAVEILRQGAVSEEEIRKALKAIRE